MTQKKNYASKQPSADALWSEKKPWSGISQRSVHWSHMKITRECLLKLYFLQMYRVGSLGDEPGNLQLLQVAQGILKYIRAKNHCPGAMVFSLVIFYFSILKEFWNTRKLGIISHVFRLTSNLFIVRLRG